ncbi:glycosyltransferase [Ornithinibacillus halophilus]|uniref:Glycosyltransferase involved in cell wall bisynthesis n=1 Tax=Ornithinibacillus halophilus TaxID=930117 RepID=A0A1M5EAB3_9BACI|nr:glycosyltransferase [Ornithinibacillus halophilus]SHF76126.1 Glycosyltransferase involved in cell wall bisynthesis [Ornithinibacillus halophilus]
MKKIKVVFFIYQLGSGGAARTLLNIVNNIDRGRFEPVLVTLNYEGNYEHYLHEDVPLIKLPTRRLRSAIIPLSRVIRRESADIVFSTIPNYNTIALLANLLSFTKAKNIVREAAYLGGSFSSNLKLRVYGMLYKFAPRVIALSQGVKDNIVKRYKVNPEKITVIYNPVDLETIQSNAINGEMQKEDQVIFHSEAKTIVTAGRLVADKDHKTLIKAFSKINQKLNVHLFILGEGDLEKELKQQSEQLNVQDNVHFVGFQKNPYVYFHHADLFVLSSKREGFGHVLAEALATGTPVVSTNCKPGAVEVLDHGTYGKLCEVGNADNMADAIYEVLTIDDSQREQMVQKGLKRAQEFNAQDIVKQYEEVFVQHANQRTRDRM